MQSGFVVGGKYLSVQPVGRGGMGAVYDAIHTKTGRRVALKLIHDRLMTSDAGRRRFEREARAAASIESLHVVQILDSGEDEQSGIPFLVMEFLQGTDLRSLIRSGPLPETLAVKIAHQICLGLSKAHEADVVHRDLKPANVFLAKLDGDRRVVKLLDFGIAKQLVDSDSMAEMTATSDVIGSPPYMSPEQLKSPRDVDTRTDVWSLGVVLYEMLTGKTPTSDASTVGERVYAICHTPAAPIRSLAPAVSPALANIVHRALTIDLATRFASADEMALALEALLSNGRELLEADVAPFTTGEHAALATGDHLSNSGPVVREPIPTRVDWETPIPDGKRDGRWRARIAAACLALAVVGIATARFAYAPAPARPAASAAQSESLAPPPHPVTPLESTAPAVVRPPAPSAASAAVSAEPKRRATPLRRPSVSPRNSGARPASTDGRDEL